MKLSLSSLLLFIFLVLINSETIVLEGTVGTYMLDEIILQSSLEIQTGGRILVRGKDYSFNRGRITFFGTFDDSIFITYQEADINGTYEMRKYALQTDSIVNVPPQEIQSDIRIVGMKGFNMNVEDNAGISLDQSMELSIEGNLTKTWNISGYIYDNSANTYSGSFNAPISRVENINITIFDSLNSVTFGNTSFYASTGYYRRQREILGIRGIADISGYRVSAAAAGQKGRFSASDFFCFDNIQGPYSLTETVSLFEYVIAPGSERIYLNGELLSSGDEGDYTINYNTGDIFFTINRHVDSSSYVYAEFQTYDQQNPVTGFYALTGSDSSRFRAMFIREEQSVSEENIIQSISGITADSGFVFVNTFTYAPSEGDYILIDSVFEYAGTGNGDYIVSFYYTGYGNGDYTYNPSNSSYIYSGKNAGSYLPGRNVDLPFESDFIAASYTMPVFSGYFRAETGGGFYKNNRYNAYESYSSDVSYNVEYFTGIIPVGPTTWAGKVGRVFMPVLYRRVWNEDDITSVNLQSETGLSGFKARNYSEITGRYGKSFLNISGSIADSLKDIRAEIRADSVADFIAGISKKYTLIADSAIYDFTDLYVGRYFSFGSIVYSKQLEMRLEKNYDRHSLLFTEKHSLYSLRFLKEKMFSTNSKILTYAGIARLSLKAGSYALRADADIRHVNDIILSTTDNRLLSRFSLSGSNGGFSQNHSFSLSSVSSYQIVQNYIYVGIGKGEFVYDSTSGTYLNDPYEGEYILIEEFAYSQVPASKRDYSFNADYSGHDFNSIFNFRYSDKADKAYSSGNAIQSGNTFSSLYADFSRFKLIPFTDCQYSFNTGIYNTLYRKWKTKFGFKMPHSGSNYFLSGQYSEETREILNTLNEHYSNALFESEMERNIQTGSYSFAISYEKVSGYYADNYFQDYSVSIDRTALKTEIMLRIRNGLSLSLMPEMVFCLHQNSDIPLSIYYRYPEGLSFRGQAFLNWNNSIINAGLRYVFEYTGKFKAKNRIEMSLYTYF